MRFPRLPPISPHDFKISRGGRDIQKRQRHIEIGEEELDANPVRVAKNTPRAMHRLKPHATASITVLARDEGGDSTWTVDGRSEADPILTRNYQGQTDETDTGSHPASEPARLARRATCRRGFYSRDLEHSGSNPARRRRGGSCRVKREMVAGQERVVWNPARSIPAKEIEFSDPEVARIKAVIERWDSYGVNADRRWLEPLPKAILCS